jgi:hypothetical protein
MLRVGFRHWVVLSQCGPGGVPRGQAALMDVTIPNPDFGFINFPAV